MTDWEKTIRETLAAYPPGDETSDLISARILADELDAAVGELDRELSRAKDLVQQLEEIPDEPEPTSNALEIRFKQTYRTLQTWKLKTEFELKLLSYQEHAQKGLDVGDSHLQVS